MKDLELMEVEVVAGGMMVVPFDGDSIWVGGGSGNGDAPGWQDLLPGSLYPR